MRVLGEGSRSGAWDSTAVRWRHSRLLAVHCAARQAAKQQVPPVPPPPSPPPLRQRHGLPSPVAATAAAAAQKHADTWLQSPRQQRASFECPCCGQNCFRTIVLEAHLSRCCPDLLECQRPADDCESSLRVWLGQLQLRELDLREAAVSVSKAAACTPVLQPPRCWPLGSLA